MVDLNDDDFQILLKQYISCFITYETPWGIHTIEDNSEPLFNVSDHEGTLRCE